MSRDRDQRRHRRAVGLAAGVLAVALALALAGCGRKPRDVDSPLGKDARPFPQTYPNPSLEQKPGDASPGVKFP